MINIQALLTVVNAVLTCIPLLLLVAISDWGCAVSEERALYLREKANKMYMTSAYFLVAGTCFPTGFYLHQWLGRARR